MGSKETGFSKIFNNDGHDEKLVLYHCQHCRSCRCVWLVKELEIETCVRVITRANGSVKDNDYIERVHPHHTVPALQIPDQTSVLLESGAICLYLADFYQKLVPESALEKAEYYNWIMYACSSLDQWMEPLYVQWYHTELSKRDQKIIDDNAKKVAVAMACLEKHLSTRQFICGDNFTAADCVIGYNIWWASAMEDGKLIQGLTSVHAYLKRLNSRQPFLDTFELI